MKVVIIALLAIIPIKSFSQQTTFETFSLSHDIQINDTLDIYIEWKTSHDATILHCVEYESDSTVIKHTKSNILEVSEDNVSVKIKAYDDEGGYVVYFWKDGSKVLYEHVDRYIEIKGSIKY